MGLGTVHAPAHVQRSVACCAQSLTLILHPNLTLTFTIPRAAQRGLLRPIHLDHIRDLCGKSAHVGQLARTSLPRLAEAGSGWPRLEAALSLR